MVIQARGVHRSKIGQDRIGLDRRLKWGKVVDRGPDRTKQFRTGPDRTDQGPVFCLATDRVVARSARAT